MHWIYTCVPPASPCNISNCISADMRFAANILNILLISTFRLQKTRSATTFWVMDENSSQKFSIYACSRCVRVMRIYPVTFQVQQLATSFRHVFRSLTAITLPDGFNLLFLLLLLYHQRRWPTFIHIFKFVQLCHSNVL